VKHPLKVCVVSGGRADYGLLLPLLRLLRDDPRFDLQLVLTGQHLMGGDKRTAQRVYADGFKVSAEIEMGCQGDDALEVSRGAARVLDGIAKLFAQLKPDILLLLGDRYEIAAAALAATLARLPIAHVAGGDITEGAFDDALRHAVTKMSHLHFAATEQAARRLRQMGEEESRVHITGSPGLDLIRSVTIPPRNEFFAAVGLSPKQANLVVTFHPETLAADSVADFDELLAALNDLGPDTAILFTGANADPGGRQIDAKIRAFVASKPAARLVESLGAELYFAALTHMDVAVGNSSSGLYEAPSFGIPTVNIGDRQTGRLKAQSVIDSKPERAAILSAVRAALAHGRQTTVNPYGDGRAAERIVAVLAGIAEPAALLRKRFVDIEAA
jgi:UDP-hydrolysing UDP-N-acetyl-D-glucosamine 2-epimerase